MSGAPARAPLGFIERRSRSRSLKTFRAPLALPLFWNLKSGARALRSLKKKLSGAPAPALYSFSRKFSQIGHYFFIGDLCYCVGGVGRGFDKLGEKNIKLTLSFLWSQHIGYKVGPRWLIPGDIITGVWETNLELNGKGIITSTL